ncbi:MAG: type III PLP-dependent enzyme [Candidatus Magasanikbacteria bacterium]|nr:type III PLP-dependent enzyme [Candidatus Magasanikbacteria bacterium]
MDTTISPEAPRARAYFEKLSTVSFAEAHRLKKKYGSPLLALSRSRARASYQSLTRALPNVRIFYAIKSNPHPDILKTLKEEGASFEVASYGELKQIMQFGVLARDILNTQPFLSEYDFTQCYKAGQRWFIFDNADQLTRLTCGTNDIDLLLRLSFPNRNCQVDLSYKFGATIKEAPELIKSAVATGARVHGVSFHVGSQSYTTKNYLKALVAVRRLFDQLQHEGILLDTVDIGGGFPVPYTCPLPSIEHFALPIRRKLYELFPGMNICAEPGRFICGLAQTLITSVNGKNIRRGVPWYYLDDGVYNSFSGKVYDHCVYSILTEGTGTYAKSVLAGPTCDSFDIVSEDIMLPHLEIGDILLVPAMGAYSNVSSTTYNGFSQAKIIAID